jgi:hypothetical protein
MMLVWCGTQRKIGKNTRKVVQGCHSKCKRLQHVHYSPTIFAAQGCGVPRARAAASGQLACAQGRVDRKINEFRPMLTSVRDWLLP